MQPCAGVPQIHLAPLCKWSDLTDGTYSLGDVERFNQAIEEIVTKWQN